MAREINKLEDIYTGPKKKEPKRKCGFHIFRAKSVKEFFFIYVAKNGKTVMTSETYKRRASCASAIMGIISVIEDVTPLVYDESGPAKKRE